MNKRTLRRTQMQRELVSWRASEKVSNGMLKRALRSYSLEEARAKKLPLPKLYKPTLWNRYCLAFDLRELLRSW